MQITGLTTLYVNIFDQRVTYSVMYGVTEQITESEGKTRYEKSFAYEQAKLVGNALETFKTFMKNDQERYNNLMKENKTKVKINITDAFLSGYKNSQGIIYPQIIIQEMQIVPVEEKKVTKAVKETKKVSKGLFE